MPAPAVIDLNAIENLRGLNPGDNDAFIVEIRDIFFEDTPQRIAELEQCLVSGDIVKLSRTAHSIKGSSANLGALALRAVAEKLELHARDESAASLAAMVASLKTEYARAQAELSRLIPA